MTVQPPSPEASARLIMTLRGQGVRDTATLSAIEKIPRDIFVPAALRNHAYDDVSLPIAYGQTISQPYIVALMCQLMALKGREIILEIGTGSGYQAAVMSLLCRRVYSIERIRPLLVEADRRFQHLRLSNITTAFADGQSGWPKIAPFDRIVLACATREIPQALLEQLKPGGILVAPVEDDDGGQWLETVSQPVDGSALIRKQIMPVRFVPMLSDVAEAGNLRQNQ